MNTWHGLARSLALHRSVAASVAAALAALVALTGCASDGPDTADTASETSPVDSAAAETASLVASGVGVIAEGCSMVASLGSGVVVERSGQVATAAHTVRGASMLTVVDAEGRQHRASVTSFDKDSDLALLDVPTLSAPPLGIGTARVGPATLITWRRSDGVTQQLVGVTRLLTINIEDIYTNEVVQRTGLEVDGDVIVGQSGGPVVDANGEVIGIIYATSKDRDAVGFATDHTELRELIEARSPGGVANGQCP
ncbi:MAG: S1-C subfamily serine protease [Candidatus Azotimanducaceae bacterium]|jgi:S1-C subfamily serine protease|tara:strand:+ start:3503 stop:4264 length:762 start_codon:yes stop_codon:yes gene_type:complete